MTPSVEEQKLGPVIQTGAGEMWARCPLCREVVWGPAIAAAEFTASISLALGFHLLTCPEQAVADNE